MDRDLSLSQTLGGLRIANPDDLDADSSPPSTDQHQGQPSNNPLTAVPTNQSSHSHESALHFSSADDGGSLGFDPSSYSTESFLTEDLTRMPSQVISPTVSNDIQSSQSPLAPVPAPNPQPSAAAVARQPSRTTSQRRSNRISAVPPGYQSHPQATAAAYAAMNSKSYQANGRPASAAYLGGPGGPVPGQKDTYRLHKEPSQASLNAPRRIKSTRKPVAEAQAGVPNIETSHTERNYGSRPPVYTGATVPRRKNSRGIMNVQPGQYPNPYSAPNGSASESQSHGSDGGPLHSSEEWKEKGASIVGKHTEMVDGRPVTKYTRRGVKDFSFGQLLGEGSYSQVMLARDRNDGHEYAVKILDKRHIIKEKKVKYVNIEKDTLNRLANHPGVVRLHYTFQDERSLYFVLDFASNGELLGVLKKFGTFDEDCTRFYSAQLLETIEYMHNRGVIHRDLKPENILLDKHMHTKITDFGTAKMLTDPKRSRTNSAATGQGPPGADVAPDDPGESSDRANSFVGTAEYVSPELLTDKSACKASDLWAFGCIVYQLLAGRPPFKAGSEYLTFQKIIKLDYKFPPGFPPAARDLVERCLVLDPRQRLTIEHIKNHEFFRGTVWGKSLWQSNAPKLRSHQPPVPAPIRLGEDGTLIAPDNRAGNATDSYPPDIQPSHSTRPVHISSNSPNSSTKPASVRPSPRVITELPPPSQLDIEWSPVLAKDNERILKLGNLAFTATASKDAPAGHKHGDQGANSDPAVKETGGGGAFKRLFGGGGNNKKKTRMVMVTSNGRLLVANDSNDKKLKFEINLLADGTTWQQAADAKGLAYWCLETKEKHFTFEDPKGSSSDVTHSTQMVQEWLEVLERAKDIALSQSVANSSYSSLLATPSTSKSPTLNMDNFGPSANTSVNDLAGSRFTSGSSAGLIDQATNAPTPGRLQKSRDGGKDKDGEADNEDGGRGMSRGFKRFSKRQSKSGLAAVF